MKRGINYLFLLFVFVSCKKTDVSSNADIDTGPNLSLDSLTVLSTNIPNAVYRDLTFINENVGYAIAYGLIIKTTDGGHSWTQLTSPIYASLNKIQFVDSQNGYIIGGDTSGYLLKTIDGGQTWDVINLFAPAGPTGMFFLNSQTGFIAGENLFIKTTNGGQTWTSLKSSAFDVFIDVNFKNSNEGIATASKGIILRTNNGGITWRKVQLPFNSYTYQIFYTKSKTLIEIPGDSLIDLNNNYAATIVPRDAFKFLFLSSRRCIAIGHHYDLGFFSYGDIFITNDGWSSYNQKTFSVYESQIFDAIAKINENKIMIIGYGFSGTRVMLLTL